MGVAERYRGLISAAQRYTLGAGVKLKLDTVPAERQFPIVFRCQAYPPSASAKQQDSLLFLFVPSEALLTSDVLNDVINRLSNDQGSLPPVMLFTEDDLRLVRRALDASGLSKHVLTHTYSFHAGVFECSWVPLFQPECSEIAAT